MGNAKYFTFIYLFSGSWQCHIASENTLKSAFTMRYSLNEWVIIPMGLMNTPAMFIQTINNLFSDILDSVMAVFLDDILVYSCIVKKHYTLLKQVPVHLYQYMFYCMLKKCSFLHKSTMFFGFEVTFEGMHISDSKVYSLNDGLYLL